MTDREGFALLDNVRYVHGRDTCDEAGRPLTTYLCPYHEGYEAALDLSWKDRRAEEISRDLAALVAEVREQRQLLAILIRQGGGQMFVSDREIVAVEREPEILRLRDDERDGVVFRA